MASHRLLLAAIVCLALGGVVATGAFTSGDEATRGVYLDPADTENGRQYAEIGPNGQFQVNISNLNPDATSIVNNVFVIGTDLDQAQVWIEDDEPAVDFYRMDTGTSVEDPDNPITLTDGESVMVGFSVETDSSGVVLETIRLRAQIPEQSGNTPTDRPDTPTERPDTPTDRPDDDTPTEEPDDDTPTDRPDDDTPTDQPDDDTPTEGSDTPTDDGTVTVTQTTEAGGGAAPTETSEAGIRVVELRTDPAQPTVGQAITVTGTFENPGSTERNATLELRAGGEVIASEPVTLAPGERRTLSGTVTFDQPGAYEIALADSSVTVTVTADNDSPLEIGAFAPVILAVLALLAGGLGLLAYWRSGGPTLVVRADDASWSRLELVPEEGEAVSETDEDGRTELRFDLSGSGIATFDPAFSVRNTVSETVGLRVVAVDGEGESITRGVTIQSADGTDLTAFPADEAAPNVLDGGESLSVRVTIDRDDEAATRVASLQVETTTNQP